MKPAVLLVLCAAVVSSHAAVPLAGREINDPELQSYFRAETRQLAEATLTRLGTATEWRQSATQRREQLAEMLGLSPLPTRGDLKPVITGRTEQEEFFVENVLFQSLPGLYVTANLYVPKNLEKPAPTILYLCGHSVQVTNGIIYGNKAGYQHHGSWFARNGYVCLVVDTVQLGEIPGLHHGTHRAGLWWWNARGYTPAGVETWNGIRSLDYLSSRPEVDTNRFGITGRSGGGAYSWFVTATDDRIKVAAPVAGITDLENHVPDGCVEGHCDCMYFVNTYRWDYSMLAAMAAPRPLLLCNTDSDTIFPLDGVVRVHEKTRAVYELLGVPTRLGLVITPGGHKDTQELQLPVMRWFNRHLKSEETPVENAASRLLNLDDLRVLKQIPADAINTNIHDTFVAKASGNSQADSPEAPGRSLALLARKSFAGWPASLSPAALKRLATKPVESLHDECYEIESQPHVRLRLDVNRSIQRQPRQIVLRVRPEHSEDLARSERRGDAVVADLSVRGAGVTQWSGDAKKQVQIRRRFMLLGETVDGMRVWDIRRAIQAIRSSEYGKLPLRVEAEGAMAVNALYAALFEENIGELALAALPQSHMEGPDYLNVLKVMDIPDALAIARKRTRVEVQ